MTTEASSPIRRCPRCDAVLLAPGAAPSSGKCPFCLPVLDSEKFMPAVGYFEARQQSHEQAG